MIAVISRPISIASLLFLVVAPCSDAKTLQEIIEDTYGNAIVKVDVSTNTPVFDNKGNNICVSAGTGFLISSSYVVTAEHVYKLAPECGPPIIILRSRRHGVQRLATAVGSYNDVGLLRSDSPLPPQMCTLVVREDVFGSEGVRFGIPGKFSDPLPPVHVQIGAENSEFAPLVVLAPVVTEPGESGGPVIYQFNVVGVTRARHTQYTGVSLMTRGSNIRALIAQHNVKLDGDICNPAAVIITYTKYDVDAAAKIKVNNLLDEATKSKFSWEIAHKLVLASGSISQRQPMVTYTDDSATVESNTATVRPSNPPVSGFAPSNPPLTGYGMSSTAPVTAYGIPSNVPAVLYNRYQPEVTLTSWRGSNLAAVNNLAATVSKDFEADLWAQFMDELRKNKPKQ